jgi:hypothetical protein
MGADMSPLVTFFIWIIVGFNLTAFSVFLQMDIMIFNAPWLKALFWAASVASWVMAYRHRPQ